MSRNTFGLVSAFMLAILAGSSSLSAQMAAVVSGTKTHVGTLMPGTSVTYTIVLTNSGNRIQNDNPGNELTDPLPIELALVSAAASSGTVVVNVGTNTVTWNGPIPIGGSVTITINAMVKLSVPIGTPITNHASIAYDMNGDDSNEGLASADDTFLVQGPDVLPVPTLDGAGLLLLALLLAMGGAVMLRRRRA